MAAIGTAMQFPVSTPELRFLPFVYVHSGGAGQGTVVLATLPRGKWVMPANCTKFLSTLFTNAGVQVDIGAGAYTVHGRAVDADATASLENLTPGVAALDELGPTQDMTFETDWGVDLYATIDTANIENGDMLWGWIGYRAAP